MAGYASLKVAHSTLISNEEWKKIGERVAGSDEHFWSAIEGRETPPMAGINGLLRIGISLTYLIRSARSMRSMLRISRVLSPHSTVTLPVSLEMTC